MNFYHFVVALSAFLSISLVKGSGETEVDLFKHFSEGTLTQKLVDDNLKTKEEREDFVVATRNYLHSLISFSNEVLALKKANQKKDYKEIIEAIADKAGDPAKVDSAAIPEITQADITSVVKDHNDPDSKMVATLGADPKQTLTKMQAGLRLVAGGMAPALFWALVVGLPVLVIIAVIVVVVVLMRRK